MLARSLAHLFGRSFTRCILHVARTLVEDPESSFPLSYRSLDLGAKRSESAVKLLLRCCLGVRVLGDETRLQGEAGVTNQQPLLGMVNEQVLTEAAPRPDVRIMAVNTSC